MCVKTSQNRQANQYKLIKKHAGAIWHDSIQVVMQKRENNVYRFLDPNGQKQIPGVGTCSDTTLCKSGMAQKAFDAIWTTLDC